MAGAAIAAVERVKSPISFLGLAGRWLAPELQAEGC
jgi:hypothetical protein